MIEHHAVLVRVSNIKQFDPSSLEKEFENPTTDTYSKLGINEARTLIKEAHRKPDGDFKVKTLVALIESITEEAQQALLKTLEEPPESTRFVLVLPSDVSLLPTVLSRLQDYRTEVHWNGNEVFDSFLKGRLSVRMKQIEKNGKDSEWIAHIKSGIIAYAGEHRRELKTEQTISLEYVARHLLTRGASNKFLLEHAALVLPT